MKKPVYSDLVNLCWQLLRFGLVGVTAGLVHFGVAWWFSQQVSLLLANCYGFFVAFWVSFFGHYYFSFQVSEKLTYHSLIKFLIVAILGFLLNQTLVAFLSHMTALSNGLILAVAIVVTAMMNFILSRFYAFKH